MTAEALLSSFSDLGVDVDEESLQECVRVCEERDVDADTLVEAWVAFSLSALGGAAPSIEKIRQLERKEFCDTPASKPIVRSTVYSNEIAQNIDDSAVISNYVSSTTPKPIKHEGRGNATISPAVLSPKLSESSQYNLRKNAGGVVLSSGNEDLLKDMDSLWDGSVLDVKISQVPNEDGAVLGNKAMFGYDLLHDMASVFDNQTRYLSHCIMNKAGIKETSSVCCKSQNEVYVCGRVECDADGRLNAQSAQLQGSWEKSLGRNVTLNLQQCPQYSLFPGQTIVARGTNPRGDTFMVQEIYSDATLPLHDHRADVDNTFNGTLTMLVASGPYTTSDSLRYEPLKDFISYVNAHKPHVVIMTGPFLDSEHVMVKTPNVMTETYKSLFEKLLDNISEISVSSPHTKIVLVSSLRDAFHQNVFPTPAYRVRRRHGNITFVPDPCVLSVGGVAIGVTSTDVLMHLSQEEISLGGTEDKFSRLSRYLLAQQCFYPLSSQLPCDSGLWNAHAHFSHTPHLLILPSNFRFFTRETGGCTVINPEHLAKGTGGGTFAKIKIKLDGKSTSVSGNLACQIIRI